MLAFVIPIYKQKQRGQQTNRNEIYFYQIANWTASKLFFFNFFSLFVFSYKIFI